LRETVQRTNHEFWPDDLSLLNSSSFNIGRLLSSRLITDHYLLALAVKRGGRLATFDRAIPLSAVRLAKPANISVV
jgi:predicted nucleic acid-binding protein